MLSWRSGAESLLPLIFFLIMVVKMVDATGVECVSPKWKHMSSIGMAARVRGSGSTLVS